MGDNKMENSSPETTHVERIGDCDLVVTRSFDAPARLVFAAWTTPEIFVRWWVPKSAGMRLLSWAMDVRIGGAYRLEFGHPAFDQPVAFFGRYIELVADTRLSWTNEESEDGPITRVAFKVAGGKTQVILRDTYPNKAAIDAAIDSGSTSGWPEQYAQLDDVLAQAGR